MHQNHAEVFLRPPLVPFFPSSTFNEKFEASASGVGILFRRLFPPKSVKHQYAFIDSPCRFGWYFSRDTSVTGKESILGLHHGLVFLQVNPTVEWIRINYKVLSKWDKQANPDTNYSLIKGTIEPDIEVLGPPTPGTIDYDSLRELEDFPALMSKALVKAILHLDSDEQYDMLTKGKNPGLKKEKKSTKGK